MHLCSLAESNHEEAFWNLYEASFPKEELTDPLVLRQMEEQEQCQLLTIENQRGQLYGLAIFFFHERLNLLAYLAIAPAFQGQGFGSRVLDVLRTSYGDFTLEAESTYEEGISNKHQRQKRKNFYLRNDLQTLDYTVTLSEVEMELFSTAPMDVTIDDYFILYDDLFGPSFTAENLELETIML